MINANGSYRLMLAAPLLLALLKSKLRKKSAGSGAARGRMVGISDFTPGSGK